MPRKKIADAPLQHQAHPPADTVAAQYMQAPAFTSHLTNAALVAEHFQLDDYIDGESNRFAEFLKQYRARIDEIKKILHARMIEQGMPSIRTEHGTAYTSTIVTPKVTDREAYLDLVLDERNYETFGRGMLQVGAPQKDALDDYIARRQREITEYQDINGGALPDDVSILPPGVETSSFTRVNIKRS